MKAKYKVAWLGVIGVALVGCIPGGGGGGAPAPAPVEPVYQYQWLGTAPFCAASPTDCASLGSGWEFSREDASGDGATCASGTKVQCRLRIN
ncbi:MAG: hypothetical protein ACFCVH_12990 [Alphaproteobacteria bacterium]